ncbi:MAG: hypothetical protein KDC38_08900 [Planctomycetes bacterium]|nr:hypothetical protein [Planctomycetota bacterium]
MTIPLEATVEDWIEANPESYFRDVVQLLEQAVRQALVEPRRVAAIGLAVDPAFVLLGPEFDVVSAREIGWRDVVDSEVPVAEWDLGDALSRLVEAKPTLLRRSGALISLLDYLRFRLTGAIAVHESFVMATGLSASPARTLEWDVERLHSWGVRRDALPPIFDATSRVGVVRPDLGRDLGFGRNVWVGAGADPLSSRLFGAVEPVPGTHVLMLDEPGSSRTLTSWRVENDPGEGGRDVIIVPGEDVWYRRQRDPVDDPRLKQPWVAPSEDQWTIDGWTPQTAEMWPERPEGDVWFAWDLGEASASVAILAGMALGWWRDRRGLWRKRRAPLDYEDFYNSLLAPEPESSAEEDRNADDSAGSVRGEGDHE